MRRWKNVHYVPWVGKLYDQGYEKAVRLLILGESHYDYADPKATIELISEYTQGSRSQSFLTKLYQVISDKSDTVYDRSAFWDRVAFANYVQEEVGAVARVRPTSSMWAKGRPALAEILDELKPDCVIVCGTCLWWQLAPETRVLRRLKNPHSKDAFAAEYVLNDRHVVVAGHINHPSAPGFRPRDWSEWVADLIRAAKRRKGPRA